MKKGLLIVIIFILLSTLIASAQSIQMPQVDLEEFYPEAKPFTSFAALERTKCDILVTANLLWGGFLIQPDGENMRVTSGFWPAAEYFWSPDGSMIMANDQGKLWGQELVGRFRKILYVEKDLTGFPLVWSSDSRYISYMLGIGEGTDYYLHPYMLNVLTGKVIPAPWIIPDGIFQSGLLWSPDMSKMLLAIQAPHDKFLIFITKTHETEIYTLDRNAENPQFVTTGWAPQWHPNGEQIYFYDVAPNGNPDEFAAYRVNIDGTNRELVTDQAYELKISPDGKKAIYRPITDVRILSASELYDLFLLDLETLETEQILEKDPEWSSVGGPTLNRLHWSPDSSSILFSTNIEGTYQTGEIWVMDIETREIQNVTKLIEGTNAYRAIWDPNCAF